MKLENLFWPDVTLHHLKISKQQLQLCPTETEAGKQLWTSIFFLQKIVFPFGDKMKENDVYPVTKILTFVVGSEKVAPFYSTEKKVYL